MVIFSPVSPVRPPRPVVGVTTPSCRAASWMKSRPFRGKSVILWLSTRDPTLAELVSTSEPSAVTITCSVIAPTLKVMSTTDSLTMLKVIP